MPSTMHLKMKYYTVDGLIATLHGDIQVARRCFEASSRGLSSINVQPRTTTGVVLPSSSKGVKPLSRVDAIDLDNRFSKDDRAEQRNKGKEPMIEGE